jgi:transposase
MSFEIKKKIGNSTYIYESISFRDEDGEPRSKRILVGKLDSEGQPQYKPEYIERRIQEGRPLILPEKSIFTANEVKQSTIKEIGAAYLLQKISESIGLASALESASPKKWQEMLVLAVYLICTDDPLMYCCHWLESTGTLPVGNLTSQRVSELLASFPNEERGAFFSKWFAVRREKEYLALDITSVSSWSELIEDVAFGYNRDHGDLPQINICMLMGEESKLPVYQTVYEGSINDVSTLMTTVQGALSYNDSNRPLLLVMDKGFFSKANVNALLAEKDIRFIIPVSFTAHFAKDQVNSERKDIDSLANTIPQGGSSVRGVTKQRSWSKSVKLHTHIVYNALKAFKAKDELYTHVTKLKDLALTNPLDKRYKTDFDKYLIIRTSSSAAGGYTVNIREDVLEAELDTTGWLILVSNHIDSCRRALDIYRAKDIVEKGFLRLKNSIDLGRLRVHNQASMQNKVFVGFISLILLSHVHKVMSDNDLYSQMTVKELFIHLKKLRVQYISGTRILYPLNKIQKRIFECFFVSEPV